jgi:uncharacterized delta-60 repeat protein
VYRLDYTAGPAETNITSTELLANGKPIFFGWEGFSINGAILYKPAIRQSFEGQPLSVACTNKLKSLWGAYYGSTTQSDGKILATGFTFDRQNPNLTKVLVARCNDDLSVDTSFGNAGVVTARFGAYTQSYGYEVFVRPDGKIVIAGSYLTEANIFNFAVAQFDSDGSVDTSFGQNGMVSIAHPLNRRDISAVLQPDGKLVLASTDTNLSYTLVRLLPDGSTDLSFGFGGTVQTSVGSRETTLAEIKRQSDGKIVAVGTALDDNRSRFAIVRYDQNGALDAAFGINGIVSSNYSLNDRASAVEIQDNGKILVAGQFRQIDSAVVGILVRYFPNGAMDWSFGREGRAFPAIGARCRTLKLDSDGKILVAGPTETTLFAIRLRGGERNTTVKFDFDGDGKSDTGFIDPTDSSWNISYSGGGFIRFRWGLPTDTLAPADYDGDGKTDFAVFRDGDWHILFANGIYRFASLGQAGDLPRPGDFDDEDGKSDLAVFRPSSGMWYWRRSSDHSLHERHFGVEGDIPLIADFAQGATTPVVFRPSTGTWYRLNRGFPLEIASFRFGTEGDIPISGDFNGDWINDHAVFRPSTGMWYYYDAYTSRIIAERFGLPGDIPVAGDYDGDGKSDIAVFRPSNGMWYIRNRREGLVIREFGSANSRPIAAAYQP